MRKEQDTKIFSQNIFASSWWTLSIFVSALHRFFFVGGVSEERHVIFYCTVKSCKFAYKSCVKIKVFCKTKIILISKTIWKYSWSSKQSWFSIILTQATSYLDFSTISRYVLNLEVNFTDNKKRKTQGNYFLIIKIFLELIFCCCFLLLIDCLLKKSLLVTLKKNLIRSKCLKLFE